MLVLHLTGRGATSCNKALLLAGHVLISVLPTSRAVWLNALALCSCLPLLCSLLCETCQGVPCCALPRTPCPLQRMTHTDLSRAARAAPPSAVQEKSSAAAAQCLRTESQTRPCPASGHTEAQQTPLRPCAPVSIILRQSLRSLTQPLLPSPPRAARSLMVPLGPETPLAARPAPTAQDVAGALQLPLPAVAAARCQTCRSMIERQHPDLMVPAWLVWVECLQESCVCPLHGMWQVLCSRLRQQTPSRDVKPAAASALTPSASLPVTWTDSACLAYVGCMLRETIEQTAADAQCDC